MKLKYIPNIITFLRFILIIPIFITLLQRNYTVAFYVFIVAGLSDGLDGLLARRFNWASKFGAMIDPLADKIMMLVTYLVLTWLGDIPLFLTVLVISRDVVILVGACLYRRLIEDPKFSASRISKINTALQILLVIVILFHEGIMQLPKFLTIGLIYLVLLTTIVSFIDYSWYWGNRAWQIKQKRKHG